MSKAALMANVHSGTAQGTAAATDSLVRFASPAAAADRSSARAMKEQSDQRLKMLKATEPTTEDLATLADTQSKEIESANVTARQSLAAQAQQLVYRSFDRFSSDGNPSHLNQALKDLQQYEVGTNMFQDVTSIRKISPDDAEHLETLGLDYSAFEETPDLHKHFIIGNMTDGSTTMMPTEALYGGTRYTKYRTDEALAEARERSEIYRNYRDRSAMGNTANERMARNAVLAKYPNLNEDSQEFRAFFAEEYQNLTARNENLTQDEQEARNRTVLREPASLEEGQVWDENHPDWDKVYQEEFDSIVARDRETAAQREQANVREIKGTIEERAAGPEGDGSFFEIDFSDRTNRLRYEQDIQDIMRLGKMDFDVSARKQIGYIHDLTQLGDEASELTTEQTGLVDRLVRGVKNYVNEEGADDINVTAAYSAYRNTIRHALFGSVLTEGEIKSFNEQFGTLGQKAGPVLTQFKVGLEQVKSQLEGMMNLGDSYVSHFYLGKDEREITRIIDALDERIEAIGRYGGSDSEATVDSGGNVTIPNAPRPGDVPRIGTGREDFSADALYFDIFAPGAQQ